MKIDDIAKQLANKVNQEHYIKQYLEKIQRGAYSKGVKDAEAKQLILSGVGSSADDKGELNGKCNITRCQKPNSATWYNHSTRKHYCPSCANRLNSDEFNRRDAMRMFGHDLCTKVE